MEKPLRLPIKGLSENVSYSAQEPATTRESRNMRSQSHVTGRVQIAQRAGLSQFNTNALSGGNKVADISQVVFDNRNLTYSEVAANGANILWQNVAEGKGSIEAGAVDTRGNVYVVDGKTSIVKYSSDGNKIWTIAVPAKHISHKVRAIWVDDLFEVYVAVSEGVKSDLATMWKYSQLPDNETELGWEFTIGAFCTQMKVVQDTLFTVQNDHEKSLAYIRSYVALEATEPIQSLEFRVPFPANGLDTKPDGSIITCSRFSGDDGSGTVGTGLANLWARTSDPRYPGATQPVVDFEPEDIEDFDRRVWSWYKAEDISEFDLNGAPDENPDVRVWKDSSGHNRHWYLHVSAPGPLPIYIPNARFDFPTVRSIELSQHMSTLNMRSQNLNFRDQHPGSIPAYLNAAFVVFVVVKPESLTTSGTLLDIPSAGTNHQIVFNRTHNPSAATEFGCALITNSIEGNNATVSTPSAIDNPHGMAVVTFLCDGGLEPGMTTPGSFMRSVFRVNGVPLDRFQNGGAVAPVGTRNTLFNGTFNYTGDLFEMLVLDRRNPDKVTGIIDDEVIEHQGFGSQPGTQDLVAAVQASNEMTRIEGYFMHKYGIANILLNADNATYGHPFGSLGVGSLRKLGPPPGGPNSPYQRFNSAFAVVCKFSAGGDLVWSINNADVADQTGDAVSGSVSGLGHDVVVNSEGDIYSIGPFAPDGTVELGSICKLIDQGDSVSAEFTDGGWIAGLGSTSTDILHPPASPPETSSFLYPRLAVDKFDNIYSPVIQDAEADAVFGWSKTGTPILSYALPDGVQGRLCFVDPLIPDYDGDLTTERAENIFLLSDNGGVAANETIHKLQLVTTAVGTGSTRTMQVVGVSGGSIFKVSPGGGVPVSPTGGGSVLDSGAQYIHSTTHFSKVYFTDGVGSIQVYDPREDLVSSLEAKASGGKAPTKIKLLESWRGRLIAARGVGLIDEAYNWKMSAIDDPENWDEFPPRRAATQSVSGTSSIGPGLCPDIVNGIVPYNDDIAYFLCDHSIFMLNGDPMDGGQFDLVSDITGGAFGKAWAKDPDGNLYFFGSRGGLYVMHPGQLPQRVSLNNIERRMQNVDLSTSYIRLAWNYRDEGLHIIQCPFGAGGSSQKLHYFWDGKVGAMWEDTFGTAASSTVKPTSLFISDGDSVSDRTILMGGLDGRIRKWDDTKKDDDGIAIDAFVTCGPLSENPQPMGEARFVGPHVILANDLDGARYEMFAASEPDDLSNVVHSGDLRPGINPKKRDRVRGLYCYLRLRNSSVNQRFAVESVTIDAYPAGRKRARGSVL